MPSPPGGSDPPPSRPDATDRQTNLGTGRGGDNRGATIHQQINVGRDASFIFALPTKAWIGIAVGGVSLLVVGVLVLSPGVRRAACTVPGIRSQCDWPTMAEETLWNLAIAQPGSDGLRKYLQHHPTGFHAEEAQAQLDACITETVKELGPERDTRPFKWTVNPKRLSPLPTEDDARKDALSRGNEDAAETCGSMPLKGELLSSRVEPKRWNCVPVEDGFTCGFDGAIVCRVRDLIVSYREQCSDPGQ